MVQRCAAALILIDGVGDVSLAEYPGVTPLQAARCPMLDAIAGAQAFDPTRLRQLPIPLENADVGMNGQLDPVEPGLACAATQRILQFWAMILASASQCQLPFKVGNHYIPEHSSMCGVRCYRGRGAFESLGAGLAMTAGDIAFKCNFANVDDSNIVLTRRADRHFEQDGPALCATLDGATRGLALLAVISLTVNPDTGIVIPGFENHRVNVRYATEHRLGLVIHGPSLCDAISGTDPLKDHRPLQVGKLLLLSRKDS